MIRPYQVRRYLAGLIALVVISTLFVWNSKSKIKDPYGDYSEKKETWHNEWQAHLKKDTKVILLYTTWFGHQFWNGMEGSKLYNFFEKCPKPKNCLLTYDRSWLSKADITIFHGRDVEMEKNSYYSPRVLKEMRKAVPKDKPWVYLSHENPQKDLSYYQPYDGLFNMTATFDRRSDIFVAYGTYLKHDEPKGNTRNYAKEKTSLVAWAVSNCGLMREDYALELEKYVSLTVYGRCRKHFKKQRNCAHNSYACRKELSNYKFYLAFENNFCHDYVTEKYWERLKQDVVPVVMGANYDNGLVIPGSYIDASRFDSIQKLAEYLLYLDKNDDEYNKYFSYKATYKMGDMTIYCQICDALHESSLIATRQSELSAEYNYERNCGAYKPKMEIIHKQIENSQKSSSQLTLLWRRLRRFLHCW